MEISPETLFSSIRQRIVSHNFSAKSIKREKKRITEQRKKRWASLGGQALHLLAIRYAKNRQPAKASIAQLAYFAHRLITILPGFLISPIAAILGGLKEQMTSSDAKILGSLKQKHLLNTLYSLNEKIEELYLPKNRISLEKSTSHIKIYQISPKVYEDLKAILTYAKNFDVIHYEKLKIEIERFESFIEMINKQKNNKSPSAPAVPVFVDPHGEDEI